MSIHLKAVYSKTYEAGRRRTGLKTDAAIESNTLDKRGKREVKRIRKAILPVYAVLFAIFLFAAFYNGLVVRTYRITTDKLEPGQNVRILLITDLHSHIYGENQKDLVSLIKLQKPDIIALAGDIADDVAPVLGTELFLSNIKGIAPVYYVTGNHEYWSGDIERIKKIIRGYGVTVLEQNYERINLNGTSFIICGVDDPDSQMYEYGSLSWKDRMYSAFDELENETGYKILLSHRPERINVYKAFTFDLVLSGHAHGGQVRIPFILNGLYAPDQGWFPKYAGGIYSHGTLYHVVSRGVSYNPRLPRIFNPPEINVIDISGK